MARAAGGSSYTVGKKRWASFDGMCARAEDLPPGPSSLECLFSWPRTTVQALDSDEGVRLRLLMKSGIVVYSDYSGMDSYREALQLSMSAAVERFGWPGFAGADGSMLSEAIQFVRASDNGRLQQKVLCKMSEEFDASQSCVLGDLRERLTSEALAWVNAASPENFEGKELKDAKLLRGKAYTNAKTTAIAEGYAMIGKWISDNRTSIFKTCVPCVSHGKECPVHPAFVQGDGGASANDTGASEPSLKRARSAGFERPMYVSTSGMTCVAFANYGTGLKTAHKSEIPWAIWAAERQRFAERGLEDVAFGECVPQFPVQQKLLDKFQEHFHTLFIVTGPEMMGWPTRRTRMFCALLNRKTIQWVGPDDYRSAFKSKFYKMVQMSGDALLTSEPEALVTKYRAMAKQQGHCASPDNPSLFDELPTDKLVDMILANGYRRIYDEHINAREQFQSPGGKYMGDLHHHVHMGSPGPDFPSQVTHGLVASMPDERSGSRFRIALGTDHLTANGFHLHAATTTDFPVSKMKRIFDQITDTQQKVLSGNGMHIACVAAWLMFILSNIVRVDPSRPLSALQHASSSSDLNVHGADETE